MGTRVGQQLGSYRLLRLLGEGGFAEVYLGQHVHLDTLAAIKVLQVRLVGNNLEVFRNEARVIVSMMHPNIVHIIDFGVVENVPFLVMEYAPNGTLHERIPEGTRASLATIVPYVKQVAAALQYAHDRKLIHRDVKPGNMLLGADQRVLLSDFGLAMVAHGTLSQTTQEISGTLAYAAPEQLRGKPQFQSDQYALGIVVYEWLSGQRPFQGSFVEILGQHITSEPPPLCGRVPGVSAAVEAVVMRALQKDPHQRYPRVQDFADALEQVALAQQSASDPQAPGSISRTLAAISPMPSPAQTMPASTAAPPLSQLSQKLALPARTAHIDQISTTPEMAIPGSPTPKPTVQLPSASMSAATAALSSMNYKGIAAPSARVQALVEDRQSALAARQMQQVQIAGPAPNGQRRRISRRALLGAGVAGLLTVGAGASLTLYLLNRRPARGTKLAMYVGNSDSVWAAAWSPDGKSIASCGNEGIVHIWEAATGRRIYLYDGHLFEQPARRPANLTALAWSPDGTRIVSCGSYQPVPGSGQFLPTVHVWEVTTGKLIVSYSGHMPKNPTHSNTVDDVSWSPDGRLIVSAGAFDDTAKIWDAQTGETLTVLTHSSTVDRARWSPDGKYIATHSDPGNVIVWDSDGTQVTIYYFQEAFAWTPDSSRLIGSGDDGNLHVWETATGLEISTDLVPGTYSQLAWSPDGQLLAGSRQHPQSGAAIDLFDATNRRLIYTYTGFARQINTLAWSPDSTRIVVGGLDTAMFIWQAS